jgi:ABC-2 type transport system ATP-binding protein
MWFLYELVFAVEDLYVDIYVRNKKIKADALALEVALAGRNISEPLNMEGTNKLILRNFTKKYSTSDVYAVHDANLEIEGGQIFGFLGPNGAGKSTIIKSIVGIQPITAGSIEVCGYDVDKQPVGAKMQTGFVPDHYALYENLTGREYVNYIADLYNVSKEDREKRIEEFVERFCLQGSFDNPIKTYSHGMKQKLAVISALIHEPKLMIMDEPFVGLDPKAAHQMKELMRELCARGGAIFFSTHVLDVAEKLCDKVAIIKDGKLIKVGTMDEVKGDTSLENVFLELVE